ncbi:MAG: 2,3-bisphosphoglycerate-independent phosphoglycerate mutase [Kiritimatiellae bacterium]|nr:2,3-bisphosphoglycerate-independent phosphoglycerate mutase [Kiritimatiellia bacterium]
MKALTPLKSFQGPQGPVVLAIMDGVAIGPSEQGNMVRQANTPHLDWLQSNVETSQLKAHGSAVGMPTDDDMGNSEVGHNAIGCGRVFQQGASLVNQSIENRNLFNGDVWKELVGNCMAHDSTLHFLGLLSDGNVHSHINHLEAMLKEAKTAGLKTVRIHILLDGRDVPPTSALEYVDRLEKTLDRLNEPQKFDYTIASGGGRMKFTMDRYEADWDMVKRGWDIHVKGIGRLFESARQAIETFRQEIPGVIDQDLPGFVIAEHGTPLGPVKEHDSLILTHFRGDRAIEISRAFDEENFTAFDRGPRPNAKYAAMMQYDGDLDIPNKYLVTPPAINDTMGEYVAATHLRQLAISETQKYGHVTYFFNGNRSGKFNEELETYIEVPSDNVPFEQRPWMKAAEITDVVIDAILKNEYAFIRLNYPNGDMVGHTGNCLATEISVEAVDLGIGRLIQAVKKVGGILIASADHGNADEMYQIDKKTGTVGIDPETGKPKSKTSHTLNPVPVHIYDPAGTAKIRLSPHNDLGISSLAATCITLMGYQPPSDYDPSIIIVN